MAYKITKYKGKTSIKDTKTGKSAEINIEKFMNGGYKDINNYKVGGQGDCEPGDIECIEAKRRKELFKNVDEIDYSVNPNTGMPLNKKQGVFKEETDFDLLSEEREAAINTEWMQTDEFKNMSLDTEADKLYNPIEGVDEALDINVSWDEKDFKKSLRKAGLKYQRERDSSYNIPNPYAGVDIPSAANYLGQSIKRGDALGGTVAGLKVAAGLGRNIVSGMGQANREQQTMAEAFENLKKNRNTPVWMQKGGKIDYLAYGGKKDEELLTGEYMRGVENENTEDFNAEIEKGEYFQTSEGDIAEVVGNKHSNGGEKINMNSEDRVLSDKLTLGAKQAKILSNKYDLKLKAKNTYSDVLDKFRKKSKLDKIVKEEAEILKKIGDQEKIDDATTKNFNIQVLSEKVKEIQNRKAPIEEARKDIFDELFNIQEDSKPKDKNKTNSFEDGGKLSSLAEEYGIPIERARELVENFKNGGKKEVPKYGCGVYEVGTPEHTKCMEEENLKLVKEEAKALKEVPKGQSANTKTGLYGKVTPESYKASLERNQLYFKNHPDFDKNDKKQVEDYQKWYNSIAERVGAPKVKVDGKWGEQTDSIDVSRLYETANFVETEEDSNGMGMLLFPDETPLPPSALQGTIKPERRYDRVSASEIAIEPYLQDIKNREQAQIQNLEGLSPNVRAAVLANLRANTQNQESQIRNQIDVQNLRNKDRAMYTNAQIQAREEDASAIDRLAYENRMYRAQALAENDQNEYINQLQAINKQRFMDIENLNLINATNEDVAYVPGRGYIRKQGSSNKDMFDKIRRQYSTNQ